MAQERSNSILPIVGSRSEEAAKVFSEHTIVPIIITYLIVDSMIIPVLLVDIKQYQVL